MKNLDWWLLVVAGVLVYWFTNAMLIVVPTGDSGYLINYISNEFIVCKDDVCYGPFDIKRPIE